MTFSYVYGINNVSFFDSYWAAVHFATGILIGLIVLRFLKYLGELATARNYARVGFVSLLLWEYFEVTLRYLDQYEMPLGDAIATILPRGFFEIETTLNIVSDLILGSFGLYLAYRYRKKGDNPR